jgi:hypothetical protein
MARHSVRNALTAAVAVCAGLALGGCGVSTLTSSLSGGIFGSSKPPETTQKVSEGNLLTAAEADVGGQVDITAKGADCPAVSIAPGDNNITFSVKGGNNDGLSVMHRGEITKTARECAASNGGMSVRYGFAGRVLLGPQGKVGTITLPVKVTVLDSGHKTLKSENVKVPVTITPDQTAGFFSVTRDVVVPVAAGASARSYQIVIAFDRHVPGAS